MGAVERVRGIFSKRFGHSKFQGGERRAFESLEREVCLGRTREKKRLRRKGLVEGGERAGYCRR